MDIVIIGSGNAATVLGRKMKAAGHRILQVFGRNKSETDILAGKLNAESMIFPGLISPQADICLLAVNDDSIKKIAAEIKLVDTVVAHTAGSVSKDILKNASEHYGVFYPLQSLRKEMTDLPEIPVLIDSNDLLSKEKLIELGNSISPGKVAEANDEQRLKLHLAAVLVNNFTNHIYYLAEQYCEKEELDFSSLQPLIIETAQRIKTSSPADMQTGPAQRNDNETIQKHLALLTDYPQLKKVYEIMTESIAGQ